MGLLFEPADRPGDHQSETMSADVDWTLMSSLARVDSGMVSVGLKAEEFVSETYR